MRKEYYGKNKNPSQVSLKEFLALFLTVFVLIGLVLIRAQSESPFRSEARIQAQPQANPAEILVPADADRPVANTSSPLEFSTIPQTQ